MDYKKMTKAELIAELVDRDRCEYTCYMNIEDFITWSTQYFVETVFAGRSHIKDAMSHIIYQTANNEVFGGRKKK